MALMKSRSNLEIKSDALLHTDITEMIVLSVNGTESLVTFIAEVAGHITARHMKTRDEDVELFKRLAHMTTRQTDCLVKIVLLMARITSA